MKIQEIINPLIKRNRIILNIVIIILINLAGISLHLKCDLTKNNVYSISPVSKEIVANLADPLIIKIFFSKDLPAPYNSVQRYLLDLMEEYSQAANRNFSYEIIDVDKDKDKTGGKDKASEYGIYPVQVREIASDQLKFRNVYMGIVIIHGDLIEKINSVTPDDEMGDVTGLEYRITNLIKKMSGKMDTIQKLEHPIKVTLFATSTIPISGIKDLDKKISVIVKKCSEENYNKIEFNYVDSDKDKSALKHAESYGIMKLQWPAGTSTEGKSSAAGEGLLGLLVELDGRFEVIQLLGRSLFGYTIAGLENMSDSINKAVDSLININPNIGYITGHDERDINDANSGAGNLKSALADMYEVKSVDLLKEDIPNDVNTIIINGPKREYSDYELFKIDQFIMKGKTVFFLIDSFQEINNRTMGGFGGGAPAVLPLSTGLDKLLSAYGVSVNKDIVLDKKCYKANQQGFAGQDIYFVPIIKPENLNKDNVITSNLKALLWPKASSVSINKDVLKAEGSRESVLVSSSKESWLMTGRIDFMPFGMNPPDKSKLSQYNLAGMIEGNFASYFKGKNIPADPAQKKPANNSSITSRELLEKSVKPGKIIVAGTSEISSTVIDKEGRSVNAVFVHNALDYLAGNTKIQAMRGKGLEINPLKDTGDYARFIIKLINIAGLPLAVIVTGIFVWRKRLIRKKKISKEFAE